MKDFSERQAKAAGLGFSADDRRAYAASSMGLGWFLEGAEEDKERRRDCGDSRTAEMHDL